MKRFLRYLALAVIGFLLGVGFAVLQKYREAPPLTEPTAQVSETGLPEITEAEKRGELSEDMIVPESEMIKASDALAVDDETAQTEENILPNAPVMPEVAEEEEATETTADNDTAQGDMPDPAVASSSVGGAFSLTDMNGNAVTEKSWPGKLKLVFFGFTRCPDICPNSLDKIETALNTLGHPEKIQPIFITTDPEHDTADSMKLYVDGYDMNLVGLTGTKEQIKDAMRAYKVYAAKVYPEENDDPNVYLMNHSAYIYLMDENENMLTIAGSSDTAETLAEKIKPYIQ